MNFGAEFERRLWLHTVNPKRDVTSTKCEIFQTMFMPELRLIRNILRIFVNQIGDKTPFSPQTLLSAHGMKFLPPFWFTAFEI